MLDHSLPEGSVSHSTFWSRTLFAENVVTAHSPAPVARSSSTTERRSWVDDLFEGHLPNESAEGPEVLGERLNSLSSPVRSCPLRRHLVENPNILKTWSEAPVRLEIVEIVDETFDTRTFRLVGAEPLLFAYRPGQCVTVALEIGGKTIHRSYSMSSSPSRPHLLDLTVKRVSGGLVSNWMWDHLSIGSSITIAGPFGRFTCFDHPTQKLLLVGAGSGIAPLMSMCRWIADTAAEVDVSMLLSFRTSGDIIFRREIELLAARQRNFRIAITLTGQSCSDQGWIGLTGRVDRVMIGQRVPDLAERHVFLCRPNGFSDTVTGALREMRFEMTKLHKESFGPIRSPRSASCKQHRVTFVRSGREVQANESMTLLDLALAHGIPVDYSCRSGYCGECQVTCVGAVAAIDGEVIETALQAGEAATNGRVLTVAVLLEAISR
jgi:ferredoxin-NADP reductase